MASRYDEWNARPRMTADEFAAWQKAWRERELMEQRGFQHVTTKLLGQIQDETIIEDAEKFLGTDFDKWFLGQLHISAEGL